VLEERAKSTEEASRMAGNERAQIEAKMLATVEAKMLAAVEEVARLQGVIKGKEAEMERLHGLLSSRPPHSDYEHMRDKKGIFVIKEASEVDERSRSASGNGPQPQLRHPPSPLVADLQSKCDLLENVNKKVSSERECFRAKVTEYEYKYLSRDSG
jgi:hypothetical protein